MEETKTFPSAATRLVSGPVSAARQAVINGGDTRFFVAPERDPSCLNVGQSNGARGAEAPGVSNAGPRRSRSRWTVRVNGNKADVSVPDFSQRASPPAASTATIRFARLGTATPVATNSRPSAQRISSAPRVASYVSSVRPVAASSFDTAWPYPSVTYTWSAAATRVRRMDCCRVVQDGDFGELTVAFDVEHFDRVAKVMRARRRPRRTLTPEQRARLADRMRRINRQRQLQRQSTAQERELVGSGP